MHDQGLYWDQLNKLQECDHPAVGRRYVSGSPAASGVIYEGIRCLRCGKVFEQWCATNPHVDEEKIQQICDAFGDRFIQGVEK